MKINKCNDECRVWTGLGTQHRTHLSQIMCPGSFPLTLTATVTYLFSPLSPKSETDPVKEDIREHYFLSVICLLVSQQYVHLPLRPLGSGQASLCHVLWFCRVFSGAQGQYLSPSSQVLSEQFLTTEAWLDLFFFCPFFRSNPRRLPRSAASRTDTMTGQDMFVFVCLFSYIKWCPMFSAGEGFRQRGTAAASKRNAPGHGWVQSDRFWLSGTNSPRELNLTT